MWVRLNSPTPGRAASIQADPLPARSAGWLGPCRRRTIRVMNVTVNGEARDLPDGETVRGLVARFNLVPEKVAVELNRRLVRAAQYDQPLKEGDEVEVVTFVGGG